MANRKNQQLINFHGTSSASLEDNRALLNVGEIAVLHGSKANAALAIKISGGTGEDGQLAYFASSNALDAGIQGVKEQISQEVKDRQNADTAIQNQIDTGNTKVFSKTHTIASAMSVAETAIANLKASASTYYDNALQGITAEAGEFVTVNVGAKTGTPNAGSQKITVGVTTGTVEGASSSLTVASDVKGYVDKKVGAVDEKLGNTFTKSNTVQKVVGTGFTSSSLTEEIVALKNLTGDTESALQAISASTTEKDALENVVLKVSEKKGEAGKHYQEIGITVRTGSTSTADQAGLAKASEVYSSISTAKSTLVGKASDASSASTIYGAKKYADEKVAAVKINAEGDTYVTATTTAGHNIKITTDASTDISGTTEAGKVADALAVKTYVEATKDALNKAYKGADDALDNKITDINKIIGDGFTSTNTITSNVSSLDSRLDKLEEISAQTKSALQAVYASPATDDGKYISFTNSVEGVSGKVVADILIGDVSKGGTANGLADAAAVRTRINSVVTDLDGVSGKVQTLIGNDSGKSVRKIANEELAAQLIPENAKESLNELKEIAAWIQSHPDDAAAMNESITEIANITFGGWDISGNTINAGLSGAVATLQTDLETETTNRTNADTEIKNIIGDGFTTATTITSKVSGLDTRITTLEGLTGKTNSAAQGVSGKTGTPAQLAVSTTRDGSNNVTITYSALTGDVADGAATLVTGGKVYTAVSNAESNATKKANEKVETVQFGEVTEAVEYNQYNSGAKVNVPTGVADDKAVTLDLSELIIDCGTF